MITDPCAFMNQFNEPDPLHSVADEDETTHHKTTHEHYQQFQVVRTNLLYLADPGELCFVVPRKKKASAQKQPELIYKTDESATSCCSSCRINYDDAK